MSKTDKLPDTRDEKTDVTDDGQFYVGDLVTWISKLNIKRPVYKVASGNCFSNVIKVLSKTNPTTLINIYTSDLELFCNQVHEVEDIGKSRVCDSCPQQLNCLAYQIGVL